MLDQKNFPKYYFNHIYIMYKSLITAIFFIVFCIFIMLNLASCSDMYGSNPFPDMPDIEERKIDLTNPKLQSKDETVGGQQEPQLQNQVLFSNRAI